MKKLIGVVCAMLVVTLVGCACQTPEPQPAPMPYKGENMAR